MTSNSERGNNRPPAPSIRKRSIAHPRDTLKEAEELAKIVYTEGGRHCDQDTVAKAAGFSGANNGSFATRRATAIQFGLVETDGDYLSVTQEWIDVFLREDPQELQEARQQAMRRPDLYKQLLEEFRDRQLPNPDKLAQQLHLNPKYGILKDAATTAANAFFESATYAGLLNERNFLKSINDAASSTTAVQTRSEPSVKGSTGRPEPIGSGENTRTSMETQRIYIPEEIPGLFRYEIPLINDTVVYLFAPRRLPRGEKGRLKMFIDLMLEEPPASPPPPSSHRREGSMEAGFDSADYRPEEE